MSIHSQNIEQERNSDINPSIKGCKSVTDLRKVSRNHPKVGFVNINVHAKFGLNLFIYSKDFDRINVKQHTTFGKIMSLLSGKEILISINGCNSVTNLGKVTRYNPNIDLVKINAYTNSCQNSVNSAEEIRCVFNDI